jgi:putative DNA modification/repair radical SAM protein
MGLTLYDRLGILADAAKYDASCASSGTTKRHSLGKKKGIGSTESAGICHSYAPDGRCISLLKILMTNACMYDCAYCINRASSNVRRARFTPKEVVDLTLSFYKRNYIEGLFLSSGIIRSNDHTMEQLIEVARSLREDHGFRGYIHLKTIPDASPDLLEKAGFYADRLSINVELPTSKGLEALAPEKSHQTIRRSMGTLRTTIDYRQDERKRSRKAPRFAPGGQSTQMIIGADASSDLDILKTSTNLYASYRLKRVYYSAFSPIPSPSAVLPLKSPPLLREHRLYQADWLTRFYDFSLTDISDATDNGMLDLAIDPKLAYALKHRAFFPVDVNRASKEQLLRVPGFGTRTVAAILRTRPHKTLRLDDIIRLSRNSRKAMPFITTKGWQPGATLDSVSLEGSLRPPAQQLELFAA